MSWYWSITRWYIGRLGFNYDIRYEPRDHIERSLVEGSANRFIYIRCRTFRVMRRHVTTADDTGPPPFSPDVMTFSQHVGNANADSKVAIRNADSKAGITYADSMLASGLPVTKLPTRQLVSPFPGEYGVLYDFPCFHRSFALAASQPRPGPRLGSLHRSFTASPSHRRPRVVALAKMVWLAVPPSLAASHSALTSFQSQHLRPPSPSHTPRRSIFPAKSFLTFRLPPYSVPPRPRSIALAPAVSPSQSHPSPSQSHLPCIVATSPSQPRPRPRPHTVPLTLAAGSSVDYLWIGIRRILAIPNRERMSWTLSLQRSTSGVVPCCSKLMLFSPAKNMLDAYSDVNHQSRETQVASSPPYLCSSSPNRSTNPLVFDARFGDKNSAPLTTLPMLAMPPSAAAPRMSGCVRTKFGPKPAAICIKGFDCLDRDGRCSSCGITAVA
ncbi:hypothetical protein Taro_013459 [Colocasia esculenta]|uniref:Uncharacterized protein n=1 Tax=Colocasia esculenta TaxID=4460 RepID=A0A843UBX2_COLES|nr:hypothetical protein [Colocasia esculenta]